MSDTSNNCGTCPEGYVYDDLSGQCVLTETVQPTLSDTIYTVEDAGNVTSYGNLGAAFYEDTTGRTLPFTASGTALYDANLLQLNIDTTIVNSLWGNSNNIDGRLNNVGVWGTGGSSPTNEWIGFTSCVNVPETKEYNIGIAGDNRVRIKIDGVLFANFNTGNAWNFRHWHVLPITLTAGQHVIELEGLNDGSDAAFAAEIYDASQTTLQTFTTPAELQAVTIFTTFDKIGETFDLGQQSGYSCPDGYALSVCEGAPACVQKTFTEFEECNCYLAINCEDPNDTLLITFGDNPIVVNPSLIYVLDVEPDKCFTLSSVDCTYTDDVLDAVCVAVTDTYDTCQECAGNCYIITDCETGLSRNVQSNLENFIGKIIQVDTVIDGELIRKCYQVSLDSCTSLSEPFAYILIEDCFETCEECLPEPVVEEVVEVNLNHRTVRPGWNPKVCSPEYLEKVSCKFSEALFQEAASKRYGIEFCCNEDADKWTIKKQLLDLEALIDPEACVPQDSPSQCCPPCNVEAELLLPCDLPRYVIASIELAEVSENCRSFTFTADVGTGGGLLQATLCDGSTIDTPIPEGVVSGPYCIDLDQPISLTGDAQETDLGTCS